MFCETLCYKYTESVVRERERERREREERERERRERERERERSFFAIPSGLLGFALEIHGYITFTAAPLGSINHVRRGWLGSILTVEMFDLQIMAAQNNPAGLIGNSVI